MLRRFEENILISMLIIMTIVLGMQIISRYIFKSSISWSEELVRYLFIWSTFLGIPYCIKKERSLKVVQIIEKLPERTKKIVYLCDGIIILVFFVIIFIGGILVMKDSFVNHQLSPAMGIPMWIVNLSVPVGSFLSIIRISEKIIGYNKVNF